MKWFHLWTCAQVFKRLDDFVDRELQPEELARIELHLRRCRKCTQRFQFEASVLADVKDKMRRIQMPEGMAGRLHETLLREAEAGSSE